MDDIELRLHLSLMREYVKQGKAAHETLGESIASIERHIAEIAGANQQPLSWFTEVEDSAAVIYGDVA